MPALRPLFLSLALAATLAALAVARRAAAPAEEPRVEPSAASPEARQPNVLFLVVDDLRAELGCYGSEHALTPRIDGLAASSTLFLRAYCQEALCNPSRASVLTGRRPDTTGVHDLRRHFRVSLPDVATLPEHFKAHGYQSVGMGKVYHPGIEDERSWSVPWTRPTMKPYRNPENQDKVDDNREEAREQGAPRSVQGKLAKGPPTERADVADEEYYDGALARLAADALRGFAESEQPFFLAVGFLRPHLPFNAPERYWKLYEPESLPRTSLPVPPAGAPPYAVNDSGELKVYDGVPHGRVPGALARELVHGYFASVSYVDAQVGYVLDELERLGLADDTIVVLWSDHGYKLGDFGEWGKLTDFEIDARVPLLVRAPGRGASAPEGSGSPEVNGAPDWNGAPDGNDASGAPSGGARSDALVELVDLYPTLCELAGLPLPDGLEGTSFAPLLDDPTLPWKRAVFHQIARNGVQVGRRRTGELTGYAVRTADTRYVRWVDARGNAAARELYDLRARTAEDANLALGSEHAERVRELDALLDAGWRAALPPVRKD